MIDSPDSEPRLYRFQDERFFALSKFGTFEIPKEFLNMHQKKAATPKIVRQARVVWISICLDLRALSDLAPFDSHHVILHRLHAAAIVPCALLGI